MSGTQLLTHLAHGKPALSRNKAMGGNNMYIRCDDGSGQQCSLENSTCADGKSQHCHGRGPLFDKLDLGIASCYEIGKRQYDGARSVYVR